jgi:hypothetical protein
MNGAANMNVYLLFSVGYDQSQRFSRLQQS